MREDKRAVISSQYKWKFIKMISCEEAFWINKCVGWQTLNYDMTFIQHHRSFIHISLLLHSLLLLAPTSSRSHYSVCLSFSLSKCDLERVHMAFL